MDSTKQFIKVNIFSNITYIELLLLTNSIVSIGRRYSYVDFKYFPFASMFLHEVGSRNSFRPATIFKQIETNLILKFTIQKSYEETSFFMFLLHLIVVFTTFVNDAQSQKRKYFYVLFILTLLRLLV